LGQFEFSDRDTSSQKLTHDRLFRQPCVRHRMSLSSRAVIPSRVPAVIAGNQGEACLPRRICCFFRGSRACLFGAPTHIRQTQQILFAAEGDCNASNRPARSAPALPHRLAIPRAIAVLLIDGALFYHHAHPPISQEKAEGIMAGQSATIMREELGLGDHVAFFFKNNADRLAFVIPYMVSGLRNRERCVYIADRNSTSDVVAGFKEAGVDVDAATASGALSVVAKEHAYLRHGIFEPAKMIADLDRDVRSALRDGFSGLRVTGERSWALDLPSALSRLCEYEEELRRRWPAQLGGLCQYDESLFPADVVERMAGCHWVVVRGGTIIRHDHRTAHPE
jgi:hypothetical protein